MNYSENALEIIYSISKNKNIDLLEAASVFCEEQDIEYSDFVHQIDKTFLDQLKYIAIQDGMIRKSIAKSKPALPFL